MTTRTPTDSDEHATDVPTAAICNSCPHPVHEHDAVAARYCAATVASAISRGCICKP